MPIHLIRKCHPFRPTLPLSCLVSKPFKSYEKPCLQATHLRETPTATGASRFHWPDVLASADGSVRRPQYSGRYEPAVPEATSMGLATIRRLLQNPVAAVSDRRNRRQRQPAVGDRRYRTRVLQDLLRPLPAPANVTPARETGMRPTATLRHLKAIPQTRPPSAPKCSLYVRSAQASKSHYVHIWWTYCDL